MLRIIDIIENKESVIKGLVKKQLNNASQLIDEVIEQDNLRKKTQSELDDVLQNANAISRQIGTLMKEGKRDEAEIVKQETGQLKLK